MQRTRDKTQLTVSQSYNHKSHRFNRPNVRPKKIYKLSVILSMSLRMTSRLLKRKRAEVLPTLSDLKTNLRQPNRLRLLPRELALLLISKLRICKQDLKRSKLPVVKR